MVIVDYLPETGRSFLSNLITSFNKIFPQNVSVRGNRVDFSNAGGKGYVEFHELEEGIALLLIDATFIKDVQFVCDPDDNGFHAVYFFVGEEKMLLQKANGEKLEVGCGWENGIMYSNASAFSAITVTGGRQMKCAVVLMHKRWLGNLLKGKSWIADLTAHVGSMNQFTQPLNIRIMLSVEELFNKSSWEYTAETYLQGNVRKLLAQLYDTVLTNQNNDISPEDAITFENVLVAMKLRRDMENDISVSQLTIDQMAERCMMSKVRINTLFKALYGEHVMTIAHKLRMQVAVQMLLKGHSILEIGRKVGYGNTSHFARIFFSVFKITPKKYQMAARPMKERHKAQSSMNLKHVKWS